MSHVDCLPCSSEFSEDGTSEEQEERTLSDKTWRIFLGGVLNAHSDADVSALFASFGITVLSIERLGPYKERVYYRRNKRVRARYERRLSFLTCRAAPELDRSGDERLLKAIRSLHGTRWKGATLRCQVAKPSGIERVREEIRMDQEADDSARESGDDHGGALSTHVFRDVIDGDNKVRFDDEDDDTHDTRPRDVVWQAIETPKQAVYNYERHLEMCQELLTEQHRDDADGDENKVSAVEAFLQAQDAARSKRLEERRRGSGSRRVYEDRRDDGPHASLAVVDFVSDDDHKEMAPAVNTDGMDLSRFDDDDDNDDDDDDNDDDNDDDEDHHHHHHHPRHKERKNNDRMHCAHVMIPQVDGADDRRSSESSQGGGSSAVTASPSTRSPMPSSSVSSLPVSASSDTERNSESDDGTHSQLSRVAHMFPGGASFHTKDETSQAHMQAMLDVHSERIRASLKQYRKRARRVSKSHH